MYVSLSDSWAMLFIVCSFSVTRAVLVADVVRSHIKILLFVSLLRKTYVAILEEKRAVDSWQPNRFYAAGAGHSWAFETDTKLSTKNDVRISTEFVTSCRIHVRQVSSMV